MAKQPSRGAGYDAYANAAREREQKLKQERILAENANLTFRDKIGRVTDRALVKLSNIIFGRWSYRIRELPVRVFAQIVLWFLLFYIFLYIEFGAVYFIISMIYVMYQNTGTRKPGELSAYSVFNEGQEELPGEHRTACKSHCDRSRYHVIVLT
jgi:hypothetical protein